MRKQNHEPISHPRDAAGRVAAEDAVGRSAGSGRRTRAESSASSMISMIIMMNMTTATTTMIITVMMIVTTIVAVIAATTVTALTADPSIFERLEKWG